MSVAAVLCAIAAVIALWPVEPDAQASRQTEAPPLPIMATLRDPPAQKDMEAEADRPPTQITNPFDASEVFEFPAGTPQDTARELVAEMLLERASERRARIGNRKHAPHLANASLAK